jgi:multidrug efflux pump subunit AcrA (membrane-fusion protein)
MNRSRLGMAAALALLAGLFFTLVPIPRSLDALAVLQVEPGAFDRIVVPDSGGYLDRLHVEDGQQVREGQILAALTNPRLEIALGVAEADRQLRQQQHRDQIAWLTGSRGAEYGLTSDLEQTLFELQSLTRQQSTLRRQSRQLVLRAPRAGTVMGLRSRDECGKWLERGVELCRVGDPTALRAVLVVEPADHQRIHPGATARVRVHGGADHLWPGVVSEIAQVDASSIPPQLSSQAGGEIATKQDPDSRQEKPRDQQYLVAVRLAQVGPMLVPGSMGRARIQAESRTLWWQVRRHLALTFNWGL